MQWLPEVEQYKRKTDPIFLLGFKEDLRQDPKTIEQLSQNNQAPITAMQVSETSLERYIMESAATNSRDRAKRWRRRLAR
jgi:GTPase SAR1 family protein